MGKHKGRAFLSCIFFLVITQSFAATPCVWTNSPFPGTPLCLDGGSGSVPGSVDGPGVDGQRDGDALAGHDGPALLGVLGDQSRGVVDGLFRRVRHSGPHP